MGSNSEKGHGKNVANFEQLTSYCASLGTAYNPSKAALKLTALQSLYKSADNSLNTVNATFNTHSNVIAAREAAFKPLKKLITRVSKSFESSDVTDEVKQNAKSIVTKLQGQRVSAKLTEEEKKELAANGDQTKQVSASQMSFDSRILNLDKFIKLLASTPQYAPNETDLKTATLTTLYTDLKTKNTAAFNSEATLINARATRDDILYKDNTGLVDIALEVKKYLMSLDGGNGPKYKAVSKLVFTKIKP